MRAIYGTDTRFENMAEGVPLVRATRTEPFTGSDTTAKPLAVSEAFGKLTKVPLALAS